MATTHKKLAGKSKGTSTKKPAPAASSGNKRPGKGTKAKVKAKGVKNKPESEDFDDLGDEDFDKDEPRRLGIRGAAPWAARHAAKHAAEARARAAEPPPPGSARATLRSPTGAEEIKARVVELHNALVEIKTLRKNLSRNFYAIGRILRDIQERKLYEARGFGTFEALLDREVDIGKTTSLRLTQVVDIFQEEAAIRYGMDHVLQALATLETGHRQQPAVHSLAVGAGPAPLPMRPPVPKK